MQCAVSVSAVSRINTSKIENGIWRYGSKTKNTLQGLTRGRGGLLVIIVLVRKKSVSYDCTAVLKAE